MGEGEWGHGEKLSRSVGKEGSERGNSNTTNGLEKPNGYLIQVHSLEA